MLTSDIRLWTLSVILHPYACQLCWIKTKLSHTLCRRTIVPPRVEFCTKPGLGRPAFPECGFQCLTRVDRVKLGTTTKKIKRWWVDNMHFIRSCFHKSTSYLQPFAFGTRPRKLPHLHRWRLTWCAWLFWLWWRFWLRRAAHNNTDIPTPELQNPGQVK